MVCVVLFLKYDFQTEQIDLLWKRSKKRTLNPVEVNVNF